MSRTEIHGDQVQDESLTGDDILDGTVQRKDIDITTVGQSVMRKLIAGTGVVMESYTGADEGTGDVEISSGSGNFGGNFYSFFDNAISTTTSNNWVTKAQDATPIVPDGGKFILFYTAEMGQTLKSKSLGSRFRYRINTGAWILISDVRDGIALNDEFQLRTGFVVIDGVLSGDYIEVQIQYGQTDDGGTASIQNAGYITWRLE